MKSTKMSLRLMNILVEILKETAAKMKTDAKPMFLVVNGVSPLPFSSGWTGRICREMDIQGMVKTQRHQKHSDTADQYQHWKLRHVMVGLKRDYTLIFKVIVQQHFLKMSVSDFMMSLQNPENSDLIVQNVY